ncbi:MAG: P1 family peptidase, partial [Anaerolineae bacterium]|nr:P1 family peptidase [Anaerolineae bacterium]
MDEANVKRRARELGIVPGILPAGPLNAITDVAGVCVGQVTVWEGDDVRTGVTAILPHGGNLFQEKVPAGLAVGNGFGKLMGATQIAELGEIETPIVLTNTLAVPRAADAILDWTLAQPGNEAVTSVNPVVGETNDGRLNNIRRRAVTVEHALAAIRAAAAGPVAEGCVGAGTGTVAFGWKGGIGTSSRRLPAALGGYTVGVLVQSNFGGVLQIAGIPVGRLLGRYYLKDQLTPVEPTPAAARGERAASPAADGSIMIVLATDAPLADRNLTRLARRAFAGLARTGAAMANGSGDYALAFSTAETVRRTPERRRAAMPILDLPNDLISPLFLAAIEATEEAIYNSLLRAVTVTGYRGFTVEALPLEGWMRESSGSANTFSAAT